MNAGKRLIEVKLTYVVQGTGKKKRGGESDRTTNLDKGGGGKISYSKRLGVLVAKRNGHCQIFKSLTGQEPNGRRSSLWGV